MQNLGANRVHYGKLGNRMQKVSRLKVGKKERGKKKFGTGSEKKQVQILAHAHAPN